LTEKNKSVTSKQISDGIRRDLGLSSSVLAEGYVALPKQYDLATEMLSAKAKEAHRGLYELYTKELSRISAEIDAVDKKNEVRKYQELKWEEIFNMNAVYLHELYFANISDLQSEIGMDTLAYMRFSRDFGTFDNWQFDFVSAAQGSGNGWAVCAYSTYLRKYINFFVESHNSSIPLGCYPVVVIDVWEHAYFKDYMTDKKSYIYAMMKELNWAVIEERCKRADKIGDALR